MSLFEDLKALDVDVDGGLKRINGNEKLYTKLLGSFVKSINTYHVETDFDGNDYEDVIEKTHAIKGVSGNLSITPVYESYTKIVDLLRTGKPEEARAILEQILPVQAQIVECIEKYME
ncbi:MAG: Hpt domain-containing protein [Lachnospiraceae bacterium]|nr:Hpt domain-containing protein [Lachnospiraceae bacterium]